MLCAFMIKYKKSKERNDFKMSEERNEFEYGQNENGQNPQNQGGDGNNYAFRSFSVENKQKSRVWSVVSLITGILAVICCCVGWTGLVFGAVAIATAVVSRVTLGYFDGLSIAGLILGIFGFVFGFVIIIFSYVLEESGFWEEFEEEFWKEYNNQMNTPV